MRRVLAASAILFLGGCARGTVRTPAGTSSTITAPSSPTASVPLTGTFAITFTADGACTQLPGVARSRTYSAAAGSPPIISLGGATFGEGVPGSYSWNVLYGSVLGDVASLWFQDPEIWELIGPEGYVVIYGDASGPLNPQTSEWPFRGRFSYCPEVEPDSYPECEVPAITCESTHHTLTLVRQ